LKTALLFAVLPRELARPDTKFGFALAVLQIVPLFFFISCKLNSNIYLSRDFFREYIRCSKLQPFDVNLQEALQFLEEGMNLLN
jgi:hypothetical protein